MQLLYHLQAVERQGGAKISRARDPGIHCDSLRASLSAAAALLFSTHMLNVSTTQSNDPSGNGSWALQAQFTGLSSSRRNAAHRHAK